MKAVLAALFLLMARAAQLQAEATYYPAASLFAPGLALAGSPRAMAMGEAGTALEGDIYSLNSNPAGLARLSGDLEMSCVYGSLNSGLGIVQQQAIIGSHMTLGTVAVSFNNLVLGRYDYRDSTGDLYGYGYPFNADGALGWANTFFDDRLSFGLSLDSAYESRAWASWWVFLTGSIGAGWRLNDRVNLAVCLTRLNVMNDAAPYVPSAGSLGVSALSANGSLKWLADISVPFHDLPALRGGLEWKPASNFALRGGWRQRLGAAEGELQNGPTAGFAASVQRISMDYAYAAYGPDASHRVAVTLTFPERWIRTPPVVIQAAGGTTAARALYDLGLAAQIKNHQVDALVYFRQCLQADPGFDGAQERIDTITRALDAQGQSGAKNRDVEQAVRKYFDEGLKYFKNGEFKKAIASFEVALEVDKKNADIVQKIREARQQLEALVTARVEAGNAALEAGNLVAGVHEFYEALKLDPENQGAKARISSLKPKISAELKRLHRKGIDAYVDDRLDEAVELWTQALALDPADPDNVGRDLGKAKKLKDLRK